MTKPRAMISGMRIDRAGLPVDGDDRHDHAVDREVPAIAQHFVADLADARAVDEHAAGRTPFPTMRAALVIEADHVAVLGGDHVHRRRQAAGHQLARRARGARAGGIRRESG